MTTPVDQPVREHAATSLDSSIALTAGAGSGKTSVLVARVVHLLRSGCDPRRIAAVTFTEKAAGELEERVRSSLEEALEETPDDREELLIALRGLTDLHTSTIHSFCQTLLIEEALEAGWNPDAEVVNEAFSADATHVAFEQWWRRFESEHPDAALLLHEAVSERSLNKFAGMCLDYRDLEPVVDPDGLDWDRSFEELLDIADEIEQLARHCEAEDDKLLVGNTNLRLILEAARERSDAASAVAFVLASGEEGYTSYGRASDWGGKENKAAFKDAVHRFVAWRKRFGVQLHSLVVTHLREHFVERALELKAISGEYDFQDLLFQAARLLRISPGARARLADRYDAILIDEVQDTDPIQAEVAMLLARHPSAEGRWDAHPPREGALFAVGDPKQSIYRFRRADVHLWRALRDAVTREGEALSLQTNFRSVPGIVEWVNETFRELPEYEEQVAFRPSATLDPVVELHPGDLDTDESIVRHLLGLREQGATVVDKTSGEERPVRWGDVMILMPGWGKAAGLQRLMLRAGIDAVVEGGSTFFSRDEVRLLVAAMRAIEEPADAEAIVFVLRGLFGFDHQTLVDFVQRDGAWRYTIREQPDGIVAEALDILRSLHYRRERQSWVSTLDQLLDECWAPAVWSGMQDGRARLANVAKFHSLVREAERTASTPGEALQAIRELEDEDDKRELPLVDFDSDAVRITTYFSAKGLEAPVVMLAHSNRWVRIDNYGAAASVNREDRTVAMRIKGLDPPDWDAYKKLEKEEFTQEQRRWMYVAATRARDQLVIVSEDRANLLDYDIRPAGLPDHPEDEPHEHGAQVPVGDATVRVLHAERMTEPEYVEETFPGFPDVTDYLERGTVTTHSTLTDRQEAMDAAVGRAKRNSTIWRSVGQLVKKSGRARKYEDGVGAAGGTVVHMVMANLDLALPFDELKRELPALVDAYAASEGVGPETRDKCETILHNMLQHPVIERARRAPERWVETPFTMPERGRIVSGIIDLCFPVDEERTRWVVVDWKSNLPPEGTPERKSYEDQLSYYAKALIAAVTPCEDVETVLVGPHPELLADPLEDALEFVDEDLAPILSQLVQDGVPLPEIGLDVGEPIVGMLELAWPDERYGVALDIGPDEADAMRADGWKLLLVDSGDTDWTETVYRHVARYFDVEIESDEGEEERRDERPVPAKPDVIPVDHSELRGTPGVLRVDEEKRIAYATDLPRQEMLALVAKGWMVMEAPDDSAADSPAAPQDLSTDERPSRPESTHITSEDRLRGMLYGIAIGDALGRPTEGQLPHERRRGNGGQDITDYLPNQYADGRPAGTPSDDSQLAFRTVESLLEHGELRPADLMRRFAEKRVFGLGSTVRAAIEEYHNGTNPLRCGQPSAGNGAMMRIAPVVLPHWTTATETIWSETEAATRITHDDDMAVASSFGVIELVLQGLSGERLRGRGWIDAFLAGADRAAQTKQYRPRNHAISFEGTLGEYIREHVLPRWEVPPGNLAEACNEFYSGAYLMETVPCVLLILANCGHDAELAMIRAVNDTKDNDTVAAIVGGILGTHHGLEPLRRWLPGLTGQLNGGDDGRIQSLVDAAVQRWA